MGYEINVSLNGKHLFATHERSIRNESQMKECLKIFKEKFPESEGYKISAEYWNKIEKNIDVDSILNE